MRNAALCRTATISLPSFSATMANWRLQLFVAVACLVILSNTWLCAASDDDEDEEEIIYKNVVQRKLVTATPTARSILKEHDKPATDTKSRSFAGVVLGYLTPWYGWRSDFNVE